MNIDVSDFGLYLNIAFFSVLLIGLIFGLIRGFRKSLYRFIITLIFFAVFFLTVNAVVGWFYTANIGFLNNLYSQYLPIQGEITSIQDVVHLFLLDAIGEGASIDSMGDEVMALIDALGIFVVKIAYTIIYFTVFQIIYRFILFIAGLFIFAKGRAKNKKGKRNRPMGAVFGTLTAALNLFVMLIVLSGIMSIGESLATLEIENVPSQVSFEPGQYSRITDINDSLQPVGRLRYIEMAENDPNTQLTEALDSLKSLIEVYNSNIVIQGLNAFQVEDEFTGENENMAIVLFDEVISINYKEEKIDLRQDIKSFAEVASLYLNSDYYQSGDLSDVTSQEITNAFSTLSDSKLLVTLIPVGIEFGINQMEDSPIVIDDDFRNLIYEDINWKTEINQLGVVASAGFMILENANALAEGTEFKTVAFSPTLTETMFDELASSKIAEYGSFVALEYLMESNETLQSVITVPDDLNFADEFRAFGDIANEILSQNLTIADIENAEGQDLLVLFSGLDLEVLMNSKLTTNALVNILTGQTSINIDIEFLEIPDLTRDEWFDTLGTDGELIEAGELRHILASISILTSYLDEIDLDDIQPADLGTLSEEDIDSMFESKVLVASISNAITTLDTGGFTLVIPDSVLDLDGYIKKEEVKSLLKSITLIVEETACAPDDDTCSDTGFDIGKAFTLSDDNIRKLLAENVNPDDEYYESEIFYATAANMLTDMTDQVVVPNDVKVSVSVDSAPLEVVSRSEILNAFLAIKAIGITDIENTDFDASLLLNLSVDPDSDPTTLDTTKTSAIFASKILHATISKFLLDQTGDNATVVVPKLASEDYEGTTSDIVLINDAVGGVEYISEEEFTQILEAVLLLQLNDFTNLDIAPTDLLQHAEELLDSAILHATITDQIQQQISGGAVTVPDTDVDGNALFITTSENDEYIVKSELNAIFNALDLLDISDFNSISLDTISLDVIITNDDDLLESAILHATISTEILNQSDAGTLSVPSRDLDDNLIIDPVNGTDFIVKSEIKNTLGALELLDIDDFTSVNVDISILNKLSNDPVTDPTTLNIDNANTLLKSKIVHKTITDLIIDAGTPETVGEDPSIIVPYKAETNYNFTSTDYSYSSDLVRDYTIDDDEYIVEAEIIYLLKIILKLEITDLESFGADDPEDPLLGKILPHKEILFDSAILQATISDQLINLESDDLIIPEKDFDEVDVIITRDYVKSPSETMTDTYVSRLELEAALTALDKLDITDFTSVNLDDMTLILDKIQNENLLDSSILHATISDKIIAESEGGDLVVPNKGLDNVEIRKDVVSVTYISETEIIATLDALEVLDITDFNDLNINPSIIQNLGEYDAVDDRNELVPEKATTLFASKIIHATISKMIFDAGVPDEVTGDQQILVPYRAELNYNYNGYTEDDVRDYSEDDDEYIVEAELFALFNVIIALEVSDLNDFNDNDTENPLLARILPHRDILFDSAIIQATISDQLIELESNDLVIPSEDYFEIAVIITRDSVDNELVSHTDTYITKEELDETLFALEELNITDLNSVNIDDFALISQKIKDESLLDSAILHATVSKKILLEGEGDSLTIPTYDLEENLIRKTVGDDNTEYIKASEIEATLDALNVLEINSFEDVAVDVTILQKLAVDPEATEKEISTTKTQTLLSSKIVHATISKLMLDADDGTSARQLYVPDEATESYQNINVTYPNSIEVRQTILATDTYISEPELTELFEAILVLNISTFDDVSSLTLSLINDKKSDLLDSAILHATISNQIIDLETSTDVVIPEVNESEVSIISEDVSDLTDIIKYLAKQEIKDLLAAIVLIDNDPTHTINDITGTVDLALFLPSQTAEADGNQDVLFASSIMKATVSKQVFALEDGLSGILVPEVNQNNDSIIIPDGEGDGDAFLVKAELKALINATDLVTNMSQISDFDGDIDLSVFFKSTYPSSPETATANQDTLLSSSIMQATISNKFKDLDNNQIFIPSVDVLDQTIEYDYIVTGDYFIEKEEVKSLINVLDIVGFNNIESFDGVIDLSVFDDEDNQNALLASAIMHQTVSKKIIDNASLDVPNQGFKHDDNSVYTVLITKAANDFDFIDADDIRYLIDVMNLISTGGDMGSFNATVDTSIFADSTNQDILLKSAVMHYTVSNQIKDNNQLVVPEVSLEADNTTNETVIDLAGSDEFIVRDELKELIDVINLISSGSIDGFSSSFSLSTFAEGTKNDPGQANTNQEMLLMSAIMHATISDQVIGMDDGTSSSVLIAPDYNFSDSQIKISATGSNLAITTIYYTQTEISNLIDGLNSLGLGSQSITSFDGGLSISTLNDPGVQSDLYASSILHATISNQIINNNSLDVPDYSLESNLSNVQIVYTTTDSENYILSSEITALIDVMNLVSTGGDVNGFSGNVDLSVFDEDTNPGNQDTLLTSAIMHATVSKQILDLPDEVLLVSTYTEDGAIEANRIYHELSLTTNITEYIIKSEVKAIITGFNQLGASDLGSYNSSSSINAGDFFSDIATYLESSSFQATISKKILDGNSGNLIIPNRDETNTYDIQIDVYSEITSANMTYIESQEIEYLVNGLNELSITDFSSSVSPTSITTLTGGQLDTILLSGTLHLTIEDIIQGNGNISSDIPDKALDDLYNLTDILIKSEVKAFILASKAFAGNGADLSNIDFDFTSIAGKDETTRNTIIASMIVRNIITPEIESADASDPFFTLQASDYEDGLVSTFLTADGIRRYIDYLNSL